MKVILFGATGMIGQGTLRECLLDPAIDEVLAIVRSPLPERHAKLRELVHTDFTDYSAIAPALTGYGATFFCLGTSSVGKSEDEYRRITYDFTLAAARVLLTHNPGLTFVYISAEGTDTTEQGSIMWARVRGKTENDLLALSPNVYAVRPAVVQPLHGIVPRERWVRVLYRLTAPILPVFGRVAPKYFTTTEQLGRALIEIAKHGAPKRTLSTLDVAALAQRSAGSS
jgi:uncharacterized protein YbjT (DUF2867 family)